MTARIVAVIVLLIAIIPAFLFPSSSEADASAYIMEKIDVLTLPATHISPPTTKLNARVVETITFIVSAGQQNAVLNPIRFQYGTAPGTYIHEIEAELISQVVNSSIYASGITVTFNSLLAATPGNIIPCTTYYARVVCEFGPNPFGIPKVIYGNEISFFTPGCMLVAAGSGGQGSGAGSSSTPSGPVPISNIIVQSAAINTPEASPGQDVYISASAANMGTASGDASITLYINGHKVDSQGVTVAAGQTAPVHFCVSRNEPGTYTVYVENVPAGNFTVDVFANKTGIVYGIMGLMLLGIAGTLYLLLRKKSAC
ncbi:MAG: hypothetical protein JW901_05805 [Dehalococcoidia bacterium]|nr:hypothetical protein [Dehalococcoidia bacterium]